MRGFQQNYDVIVRAAAGDQSAREAAMDLFLYGVRIWLRINGELSLDRCLGLPPPSAKAKLAKLRRDYWLTVAHGLCDGAAPWHKSTQLAAELVKFHGSIWPKWKSLDSPPDGASNLRIALFEAVRASPNKIPKGGAHALHRIVTKSHNEMSRRAVQHATVTPQMEPTMKQQSNSHPIDATAEREWKSSPAIRAEFGDNLNAYLAYRRAEANGQARILGAKNNGISVHVHVK